MESGDIRRMDMLQLTGLHGSLHKVVVQHPYFFQTFDMRTFLIDGLFRRDGISMYMFHDACSYWMNPQIIEG